MKIVINSDYGGFGLSEEAIREYGRRSGLNLVTEGTFAYQGIRQKKGALELFLVHRVIS